MNNYPRRRLSLLENYVGHSNDAGTVSCAEHEAEISIVEIDANYNITNTVSQLACAE